MLVFLVHELSTVPKRLLPVILSLVAKLFRYATCNLCVHITLVLCIHLNILCIIVHILILIFLDLATHEINVDKTIQWSDSTHLTVCTGSVTV